MFWGSDTGSDDLLAFFFYLLEGECTYGALKINLGLLNVIGWDEKVGSCDLIILFSSANNCRNVFLKISSCSCYFVKRIGLFS
jgi:hypothetical protein